MQSSYIRICVGLTLLLAAGPRAARSQREDSGLQPFSESVEVKVINVDVVVIGKDGEPVRDLTIDDFRLYEDGKAVPLSNLYLAGGASTVAEEATSDTADTNTETAPVEGTTRQPSREPQTVAVLVDSGSLWPAERNQVLGGLRKYLESGYHPEDRYLLLNLDNDLSVAHQPSSSLDGLLAGLESMATKTTSGTQNMLAFRSVLQQIGTDTSQSDQGLPEAPDITEPIANAALGSIRAYSEQVHHRVLRTLDSVADAISLMSALDGPKVLIYAGAGITDNPASGLLEYWRQRFGGTEVGSSGRLLELRELEQFDLSDEIQQIATIANAHRTAMYLLAPSRSALAPTEIRGLDSAGNRTFSPRMAAAEQVGRTAAMGALADATGGRVSTGSIQGLLGDAQRDLGSLYSLGYTPDDDEDGKRRNLRVEVQRPDVEVLYRRSFRDTDEDQRMRDLTRSALLLDSVDNPLGAALEFGPPEETEDGLAEVPVVVKFPMSSLTLMPRGDVHEGRLSLFVAAMDDRGRFTPVSKQELPMRIPNAQLHEALGRMGGYVFSIKLRPRAHTVAVTVRDELGVVASAARGFLEEPDFN